MKFIERQRQKVESTFNFAKHLLSKEQLRSLCGGKEYHCDGSSTLTCGKLSSCTVVSCLVALVDGNTYSCAAEAGTNLKKNETSILQSTNCGQ